MLRFVGGRYGVLWSGRVDDIAHTLSGGIFDNYYMERTKQSSLEYPDASELFTILEQALKHNNLMTCGIPPLKNDPYRNISADGIAMKHVFTITDVLTIKQTRLVKIHNPRNEADQEIKQ